MSPQTERGLIAFLAALSGLSAMGIDVLLPGLAEGGRDRCGCRQSRILSDDAALQTLHHGEHQV